MSDYLLKLRGILSSIFSFIHERRKDTGGFAATPRLPATIEDTYYAIDSLELLNKFSSPGAWFSDYDARKDSALLLYLSVPFHLFSDEVKTVFQFLKSRRLLGLEIDHNAVRAYVHSQLNAPFSLQRWYYLSKILNEVLDGEPVLASAFPKVVGRFRWRTVSEAWMCLYLARAGCDIGGIGLDEQGLAQWFKDCQNRDGGFGFLPQTTSFIENCYVCLSALALLGVTPKDVDAVFNFIIGCHTGAGGFARNGMAAPFLDATWHAVASLSLIVDIV
ncbi:MAG: prenyltransferase/squalene oxidase repeat-containing protein [Dissulfurimicrobium sp.]|uniref:prenyltransferase/squalene oxidase repeat-containing protein n=1 Tax=Dissulfurimicrobium sp. TaxID=2022436 RepID=UPI004049B40E